MNTHLRDIWQAGECAVNGWLSIPSTVTAEITSAHAFDTLTVDLQHGLNDYQVALTMLQAIRSARATPMARVPWLEPGIIGKVLDAGALGVICPMVNTGEEAEDLVRFTHYAPRGSRSYGPTRAALVHGADYASWANAEIVALAMVETAQALENLEAIVATPDLDGVYIGPADLSLSMGYTPKLDQDEPPMVEAIKRILDAAKSAGIRAGIHCLAPSYARSMRDLGFDLVTLGSDVRALHTALASAVAEMRA